MENNYISLAEIWNASFEAIKRKPEKRERMWATELGKMDIDVILNMQGIEQTNEPSDRAMRKFETGDWWEWIVGIILKRSGIYLSAQDYVVLKETGLISVTGRLDYKVGGKPNFEKAKEELKAFDLPEKFYNRSLRVIQHIEKRFKDGVPEQLMEVKSCSEMVFERIERSNKASISYLLQLYHYCRNLNMIGTLIYVCKDDSRMKEFRIVPFDPILEEAYLAKVNRITELFKSGTVPAKEKPIEWDVDLQKFFLNTKVGWSSFLTLNYDIKDETEFGDIYRGVVKSWNSVVDRVKSKKPMTADNLGYLEKMEGHGFNIQELTGIAPVVLTGEDLKAYNKKMKEDKKSAELEELSNLSAVEMEEEVKFLAKKQDRLKSYLPEVVPKADKNNK